MFVIVLCPRVRRDIRRTKSVYVFLQRRFSGEKRRVICQIFELHFRRKEGTANSRRHFMALSCSNFGYSTGELHRAGPSIGETPAMRKKEKHQRNTNTSKEPDPPRLVLFVRFALLCFGPFAIFYAFGSLFPLFPKDFKGAAGRKILAFFGRFLAFSFLSLSRSKEK